MSRRLHALLWCVRVGLDGKLVVLRLASHVVSGGFSFHVKLVV